MSTRPVRRWGDPPPSVDPWTGARDPATVRPPEPVEPYPATMPLRSGRVFGRVYELFTDDPRDGEHPYAGQVRAPKTIAQRQREHKSRAEVARFPWKARIIDGPAGRRLLETVYATGDERADQLMLDQVEAFWIDRLKVTHNHVRPVRPRHGEPLPPRPQESRRPARRPAKRRAPWRAVLFAAVTLPLLVGVWLAVAALHLPWPWLPFAAAPVAAVPLGWRITMRVLSAQLTRFTP